MAMLVASGANYGVNALTGRWFDEQGFADASLMVTLLLLLTVAAVALQLMASRQLGVGAGSGAAISWLRARAVWIGLGLGAAIALPAPIWHVVFSTSSPVPFVLLGIGVPLYLAHAVDRGVLQGQLRFGALAWSFIVEAAVRLVATVALAAVGFGATGVAAALSLSFVASWVVGRRLTGRRCSSTVPELTERADMIRDATPDVLLLTGQILINNGDVLIVKALNPTGAASYAAVALIGRAVFFCSWSVVTTIFPVVASHDGADPVDRRLIGTAITILTGMGLAMTVGAALVGDRLLETVIGPRYADAAPLLWRYALAATAFTVTNLLASVDLARGIRRGPVLVVGGALVQTAVLLNATSSLGRVVDSQVIVMVTLAAVAARMHLRPGRSDLHPVAHTPHSADSAGAVTSVDLLAEIGDVNVDDMVVAEPVRPPHALA
jgi:O-antigen/teichoic acid export membrane protein